MVNMSNLESYLGMYHTEFIHHHFPADYGVKHMQKWIYLNLVSRGARNVLTFIFLTCTGLSQCINHWVIKQNCNVSDLDRLVIMFHGACGGKRKESTVSTIDKLSGSTLNLKRIRQVSMWSYTIQGLNVINSGTFFFVTSDLRPSHMLCHECLLTALCVNAIFFFWCSTESYVIVDLNHITISQHLRTDHNHLMADDQIHRLMISFMCISKKTGHWVFFMSHLACKSFDGVLLRFLFSPTDLFPVVWIEN